jgi:hypothetical protein
VTYRDDRDMLLQRIRALEEENSALRLEGERRRAELLARIDQIAARVERAIAQGEHRALEDSARELTATRAAVAASDVAVAFNAEAHPTCPQCGSRPAGWKYAREAPGLPLVKRLLCSSCNRTY